MTMTISMTNIETIERKRQGIVNDLPIVHNTEIIVPPPSSDSRQKTSVKRRLYENLEVGKERLFKKARRKFTSDHLAITLLNYEKTLKPQNRGEWNNKTAYKYTPTNELNKYGEPILKKTNQEREYDLWYSQNPFEKEQYNRLRWSRIKNCHSVIHYAVDRETGEAIYKPQHKCNDKLCNNCSRIRSNKAVNKYIGAFKQMSNPVMLVLHQKNCKKGELSDLLKTMQKDWRAILKQGSKRKKNYSGIVSWEVTYNSKKQTFHPHMHIICERDKCKDILEGWLSRDTENRSRYAHYKKGNMQAVEQTEKSLMEVLKYTTNLSMFDKKAKRKTMPDFAMYEIAKAFYCIRQWNPFGEWRKSKGVSQSQAGDVVVYENDVIKEKEYSFLQIEQEWEWKGHDWFGELLKAPLTDYYPDQYILNYLGIEYKPPT